MDNYFRLLNSFSIFSDSIVFNSILFINDIENLIVTSTIIKKAITLVQNCLSDTFCDLTSSKLLNLLKNLSSMLLDTSFSIKFLNTSISFFSFLSFIYFLFYNIYIELLEVFSQVQMLPKSFSLFYYISPYLPSIFSYLINFSSKFLFNLSKELLGYIISYFTAYYLLLYKEKFIELIKYFDFIDLKELSSKFYGIFFGHLIFWTLQAFLSFLGFYLLGIKYSFLLSLLVFIFAIIPFFGPWTVWLIIIIQSIISKNYIYALISFLYGIVFISFLTEVFIKPYLVGKYSKINPLLVFLGIIGGISIFGTSGIFLGPLILEITKDMVIKYLEKIKTKE